MNPRVATVNANTDYTLLLKFKNGEKKIYNMKPLLNFGVFKELKDFAYFQQVKPFMGTIAWPHGQDICPDTLFLDSKPITSKSSGPYSAPASLKLRRASKGR